MGLIAIEGMQFYAHHGFYKEEQVLGGKYVVDIYVETDFSTASQTDDLAKTVNYEKIFVVAKEAMEIHSKLLEHVCQRIVSRIFLEFELVENIRVRVSKLNPPIKGNVEKVYVELAEKRR